MFRGRGFCSRRGGYIQRSCGGNAPLCWRGRLVYSAAHALWTVGVRLGCNMGHGILCGSRFVACCWLCACTACVRATRVVAWGIAIWSDRFTCGLCSRLFGMSVGNRRRPDGSVFSATHGTPLLRRRICLHQRSIYEEEFLHSVCYNRGCSCCGGVRVGSCFACFILRRVVAACLRCVNACGNRRSCSCEWS